MTKYSWITFKVNLAQLPWRSWVKLGECVAKCEQLKSVPLTPNLRKELHLIYLAKGVHATTAIEGNTLTEEQVRALIQKELELPPSKQYLEQEVSNIIEACNETAVEISKGILGDITIEQICYYNSQVLANNIPRAEDAVPGKIRNHSVVVGSRYRAPDAKDVTLLMKEYCKWMNSPDFVNEEMPLHFAVIKAIIAHLYFVWIHPFGDGNGRVARLLEFVILLSSGVPSPAAHLFSNHYNMTRSEYYSQLDKASKTGNPTGFLSYAIQGFLDGLDEQLQYIQRHIVSVCWRDYIYEQFAAHRSSNIVKRRRDLAVKISEHDEPINKDSILILMRNEYRSKTERTLARDINELERMRLVIKKKGCYVANKELMLQFLPFSTSQ